MDVRFSSEQLALRDSVGQVVERLRAQAVARLDDAERSARLDAAVVASGWRELRMADEGRAPLASGVEVGIVAEELARGLADTPFLGPTLAADLRRMAGAPPSATPETVVLRADLSQLAAVTGGDPVGDAVAVDAAGATAALVLVTRDGGHEVASVAIERADEPVDLTRPSAVPLVGLAAVPVDGQARLLTDEDLLRWTALGLATTCADLVGTMRGAVELTCEYAASRQQYGVAIGSFQAVQHLLADAHVATEGSRSVTLHATWAVDALDPHDAVAAGAVAKAYCARAARDVCETAIQVHGGIGNTWECLAHVFLRRALLSIDVLGGTGASLRRVLAHHGIGRGDGGPDGLR
ncbi:MAG TPA: acyl-CoA dehydrogenase family protein [Acidimicrobiales bacterium]|nr:acyl-CoA dehydrogenase family protein [Acidimicrobiales bacterium]